MEIIPRLITAFLVACGDPHFARLADAIASARRHRATIMKFFKTKRFHSRAAYRFAIISVMRAYKRLSQGNVFISLDGVSMKRGGFTRVLNAIKYREKDKSKKGNSTKAHMFLLGVMIFSNGTRIPLPRKTYYTKEYCIETGRKFVTIVDLATEMIREAPIQKGRKVYVLADEYFEGEKVHSICKQVGYHYIMPVDSNRCFSDKEGNRLPNKTLYARGLSIPRKDLAKISFVSGDEETASYRRYADSNRGKKRVYHACAEVRRVANLGNVNVLYSRKQNKKKGKKNGETYRVFVSSDQLLSAKMMIEYYELRWQIELFFREMKSVIGIDRYRGSDFRSYERYIDVILMSVLFLETYRMDLMDQQPTRRQRGAVSRMRCTCLITALQKEIDKESVDLIIKISKSRGGKRKLHDLIRGTGNQLA